MVRLSRLLKDYRETGSLNSLLALWGFVDETTVLTKTGALGVVLRLEGCDDECFDHHERREVVEQFAQALRLLDERFRMYQYLVKRHAEPVASLVHAHPLINEALQRRVDNHAWTASTGAVARCCSRDATVGAYCQPSNMMTT